MSTKAELAQRYVARLREAVGESADVQQAEVEAIAKEIKSLTWTETRKPLTDEERLDIVEAMGAEVDRAGSRRSGEVVGILKEADNKRYLALVKALRGLLG